jgi:hypothetical protein
MMAFRRTWLLRLIHGAASLAAAAIGFAFVWFLEPEILPRPELPYIVREKAAHFAAHGNDYDAVFLGSSRVQCHVMPELFDRLMAENGAPMKSFNFGVLNLYPPENDYVLDLILARPHARLRWVFVEVDFLNTAVSNGEEGTLRGIYWHDWARLALLYRCMALTRDAGFRGFRRDAWDAIERGRNFLEQTHMFYERSVNLGRGSHLLEDWLFRIPPAGMDWGVLGKAGDGWSPAIPTPHTLARQQSGELGEELRLRRAKPPMKDEGGAASQSVLAGLLSKIAAAGATPVILLPPRVRRTYYYPAPALAARYPVIDLCIPARFPDLYREDLRIDGSHMNAAGAEVFTRILVEQFLPTAGLKRPY